MNSQLRSFELRASRGPGERRERGTVLVLVVAVLALLTVIGTVYLISSRTEKAAASATSTGVNLHWAQLAVMNMATGAIGDAQYDANGNVGGYAVGGGLTASRWYDWPEPGTDVGYNFGTAAGTYGNVKAEPWLSTYLHNQTPSNLALADHSRLTAAGFNPNTGNYDRVFASMFGSFPCVANVVNDQTTPDTTAEDPCTGTFDSYVNLLPYSDGSGIRYRFGLRILDTSRMLNLNVGSIEDPGVAPGAMLDPNGSYLTSIHLAGFSNMPSPSNIFSSSDTASLLHVTKSSTGMGRAGAAVNNLAFNPLSWQAVMLRIEKPQDGPGGNFNLALFDLSDELELRSFGEYGTPYHCRPAMGDSANYTLWPWTLSANPGAPASSTVVGNPRRRNYTTYSFSRDLRPYPDPVNPYTVTAPVTTPTPGVVSAAYPSNPWPGFAAVGTTTVAQPNVWPPSPARISANPNLPTGGSSADADSAFLIAMAATNIATAMENTATTSVAAYTQQESRAFAANYVTAHASYLQTDPTVSNSYYLPNGPSFVDDQGICVRGGTAANPVMANFSGAADLKSEVVAGGGKKIYLGYAAQPFINEIAVQAHKETTTDPVTGNPMDVVVVNDSAVELYNPYPVALRLNDFALQLNGTVFPLQGYIPAYGYFVFYKGTGTFAIAASGTTSQQQTDPTQSFAFATDGSSVLLLLRKYIDRSGNAAWAPVDHSDCKSGAGAYIVPDVTDADMASAPNTWDIERKSKGNAWRAGFNQSADRNPVPGTLGAENAATDKPIIPLYDRMCPTAAGVITNSTLAYAPFFNIGDFNRLMRIGNNFVYNAGTTAFPLSNVISIIPDQLVNLYSAPPAIYANIQSAKANPGHFGNEFIEAQLHFDFFTNPAIFGTSPPDTGAPNNVTDVDMRAIKLLDQLTFIDRVSDPNVTVTSAMLDINKIRLPGQINVNTASGDVLRSLPGIHAALNPNNIVGGILAYRAHLPASPNSNYPGKDYSGYGATKGVHSLGELILPVSDAVAGSYAALDDRDKAWASIYNLCTVRSDSFVVYGYLEAVKVNPRYPNNPHNNASDWYNTYNPGDPGAPATATGTTDDPNNAACLNLRLARLRWVAIVDRSFCNYSTTTKDSGGNVISNPSFQTPRIVAIKDLPR